MKWSIEEMEIVKKYDTKEDLIKLLQGRSWNSIRKIRAKIIPEKIKPCIKWNDFEINILIDNYKNMIKEDLIKLLPGRSWESIKLKSNSLLLNRSYDFARESNLDILMRDETESFYWIGFILADGHISNRNRISLELSIKDIDHLEKFAKYIECDNISKDDVMCRILVQNKDICSKICDKFDISNNKTYRPMKLNEYDFQNKLIFSLIIGFIDGDGCISNLYKRRDCNIRLHLHKSWVNNLIFIENFLYSYFSIEKSKIYSKIGSDGYSILTLSDNNIITKIKKECLILKLPIMERKWSKIDENRVSRNVIFENNKNIIIELYNQGLTPIEIINRLNCKKGVVYKHIRKLKNEIKI